MPCSIIVDTQCGDDYYPKLISIHSFDLDTTQTTTPKDVISRSLTA